MNDVLYTTGVGSLPLLPPEATEPSTEEQLAEQANKAIATLFTLHTRMQETAAVAASIMARAGTSTLKLDGTTQVSFILVSQRVKHATEGSTKECPEYGYTVKYNIIKYMIVPT